MSDRDANRPERSKAPTPPPGPPEERHYQPKRLNKWFALSSVVLLVTLVAAFAQDYAREWKRWQREFQRIDRQITRGEYEQVQARLESSAALARTREQVAGADDQLAAQRGDVRDAERELRQRRAAFEIVNSSYQNTKAEYERARYRHEQAEAGEGLDQERTARELERWEDDFAAANAEFEAAQLALDDAQAQLDGYREQVRTAERALAAVTREADLLRRRLERFDPEFSPGGVKIANAIRDLPILDLSQPTLTVNQVVLADIKEDLNFTQVARVDRCMTCHLGTTREDFAEVPNPHGAHPNLELFLASDSPHPLEQFGCTSCHGGRGRATDFVGTVHSPNSPAQEEDWKRIHDWEVYPLWEEPMHPLRYAEAGCFQCHSGQAAVRGADKLNFGLDVIEQAGCYSCHEIDRFAEQPKRGPSLLRVADKISPEFAFNWIKDPAAFRANTWMPSYFGQSNNEDPQSAARADQEIQAMVAYLFANSGDYPTQAVPARGDALRGAELVASVGCMGCHQSADEAAGGTERTAATQQDLRRQFGPNLVGIGSKLSARWVYSWLKNPSSYHPETRMPDMRLTDQEAADITAYLMGSTNETFANQGVPARDATIIDRIALDFLSNTAPIATAEQQLAGMNGEQRLLYAGERLIGTYGCFACHEIAGFEDAKPIGVELTDIGRKSLHQFDFGFVHIDHTRYAWWTAKLDDPRVYDTHRDLEPLAKSRMPNFRLTDAQIEAAVTALAGFVEPDPDVTKVVPRTPRNLAIEAGQRQARQMNCQGCHIIEDRGGAVRAPVTEWLVEFTNRDRPDAEALTPSFSPPDLRGEGAKVQTDWLFGFFHEPSPIRPWLRMRMPSYDMSAEERNTLIEYFTALDDVAFPFTETVEPQMSAVERQAALTMFSPDYFNCTTCHIQGAQLPPGTPDRWAPNFALASERLRPDWIIDWIADPQSLMPGTRMPAYYPLGAPDVLGGDTERQLVVLRNYLLSLGQ